LQWAERKFVPVAAMRLDMVDHDRTRGQPTVGAEFAKRLLK
jgi:hypothetical protein